MRIAALYDIHGNLFALEAVLAEIREVRPDTILIGGDVAAGPFPVETLDRLTRFDGDVRFIRGNADRAADEMRASGFPGADEFVDELLLSPPGPAETAARFEKVALERAANQVVFTLPPRPHLR